MTALDSKTCVSEKPVVERQKWSNKFEFILSCVGYAVGLGNIWRFPYLCYLHGGAVFLIPYTIMLIIVGIPMFFLELSIGQYTSRGPINCWRYSQFFRGIGVSMVLMSAFIALHYNVIIAWAVYYLFKSISLKLPWSICRPEWGIVCETACSASESIQKNMDGLCYNGTSVVGFWNKTIISSEIVPKLSAEGYLYNEVLGYANSKYLWSFSGMQWHLLLCLFIMWVIIFLAMAKGIQSSGKVVYFTAIFPYVVLVILFGYSITLKGAKDGIKFYIYNIKWEKLRDAVVWKDATVQIFYSLSASLGGLITLSSYNSFNNNILRDALLVPFLNCFTSFFSGFAVFSIIGFLASELGVPVKDVTKDTIGLVFIIYPQALSYIKWAPVWSVLFFLMLITLGIDSEITLIETICTSIMDLFPRTRRRKWMVFAMVCFILFILGIPMCLKNGFAIFIILAEYSALFNVIICAILECFVIVYVYGLKKFEKDLHDMLGEGFIGYKWWCACWAFLTPVSLMFIFIYNIVLFKGIYNSKDENSSVWSDILGWGILTCTLLPIVIMAVLETIKEYRRGSGFPYCIAEAIRSKENIREKE